MKQHKNVSKSIVAEAEKIQEPAVTQTPVNTESTSKPKDPVNKSDTKPSTYGVTLGGIKSLKDSAKEKIEASNKSKQAVAIDNDNLSAAWKKIVDELTTEKVFFRNAIGQGSIVFEGNNIAVHVYGVAYDFLKNLRLKLLEYFKHVYQNEEINVVINETIPDADKIIEQVMSTKEIFEKMAEQNPLLRKLKDNLGMDFEY